MEALSFAKELNDKEKINLVLYIVLYEQETHRDKREELNNESKLFGRLFRRIFSRTDKSLKWIDKYDDRKHFYRRGGACGPWVCGYILYVNQGKDKYDFFYNNASSFGEFGILNFALRLFGRR